MSHKTTRHIRTYPDAAKIIRERLQATFGGHIATAGRLAGAHLCIAEDERGSTIDWHGIAVTCIEPADDAGCGGAFTVRVGESPVVAPQVVPAYSERVAQDL